MQQRYLVPKPLETALWGMSDEIRSIGNTLNQIARYANTYRNASPAMMNDACHLVEQMDKRIIDFIRHPPLDYGD